MNTKKHFPISHMTPAGEHGRFSRGDRWSSPNGQNVIHVTGANKKQVRFAWLKHDGLPITGANAWVSEAVAEVYFRQLGLSKENA